MPGESMQRAVVVSSSELRQLASKGAHPQPRCRCVDNKKHHGVDDCAGASEGHALKSRSALLRRHYFGALLSWRVLKRADL
jgi:hypothetical protein